MATFYTNDPTRNAGAQTTHDPTAEQGGGGPPPTSTTIFRRMLTGIGVFLIFLGIQ